MVLTVSNLRALPTVPDLPGGAGAGKSASLSHPCPWLARRQFVLYKESLEHHGRPQAQDIQG